MLECSGSSPQPSGLFCFGNVAHLWSNHASQLTKHRCVNKHNEWSISYSLTAENWAHSLAYNMKPFCSLSLLVVLSFLIDCSLEHSEHSFDGRAHSNHEDHIAFLGEELAKEFEKLSPQESRRRLRYLICYYWTKCSFFSDYEAIAVVICS